MRTLHFDCFSGVSGDMTLAALLDAGAPADLIMSALDSLNLPGRLIISKVKKSGFAATAIQVETTPEQKHRHLHHIRDIIERGQLTVGAKALANRFFLKLAEAEASVHGSTIEKVHFHEVGAVDSIFDLVGVAVAVDYFQPTWVTSAPVPTGSGFVTCDHGRMPVPAPATAKLLLGAPLASTTIACELTTPTGAAILACLVQEYTTAPSLTIEAIGVGAGTRDLAEQPNVLRLFLGQAPPTADADAVWQVETNLDDVTPEVIGYCTDQLFAAGAVDVFTQAIQMKKQRPGVLLSVLCPDSVLAAVETTLLRETGAFGLRKQRLARRILQRESIALTTPWGPVQGKRGWSDGLEVITPEYADCVRLAQTHHLPLRVVLQAARPQ